MLAPGEDLSRKLADYASMGVPEVWVISPEAKTVEALTLEGGRLHRKQVISDGVFTPRQYPHVTVDVATFWPTWRPQQVE